ncbi:hypothetical protein EHS17_01035 [Rhodobacteraceae bacterium CH30]|nr:hypothetical protein EHS17_01035 [Rhodobacteraceae bacterium CH30]
MSVTTAIFVQIVGITIIWGVFFRYVEHYIQSEQDNNIEKFEEYIDGLRLTTEKAHLISLGLKERECDLILDELRLMLASTVNVNAIGVSNLASGRMCGTTVGDSILTSEVRKMQDNMYGILQLSDHKNVKSSYIYYRKILGDHMGWALLPSSKFTSKIGQNGSIEVLLGTQKIDHKKTMKDTPNYKYYSHQYDVSSKKIPYKNIVQIHKNANETLVFC